MTSIIFSREEIDRLRDLMRNHPHSHVRGKALALVLKSQNLPHKQIVQITGLSKNTITGYFTAYLKKGIASVQELNFKKPESALKPHEEKIKAYINKTPPATIKQACKEIGDLTGKYLKESEMRSQLKKMGVQRRKTCGIPAKADPEKQKEFFFFFLQPRLDEAEKGIRYVYFMDAAHFVLGAFLSYLWSFVRQVVRTPSGRKRFNVLGALNATTKELITVTNDTYITSIQVCEMLRLIAKNATKPVSIFLDNAKYQRCKLVMNTAQELGIELLFLPPYSPNLNLIERVWKFIKTESLASVYFSSFDLFKSTISDFLSNMHTRYSKELKTLLAPNFQVFTKTKTSVSVC